MPPSKEDLTPLQTFASKTLADMHVLQQYQSPGRCTCFHVPSDSLHIHFKTRVVSLLEPSEKVKYPNLFFPQQRSPLRGGLDQGSRSGPRHSSCRLAQSLRRRVLKLWACGIFQGLRHFHCKFSLQNPLRGP